MKKLRFVLSRILPVVLIAVLVLSVFSCGTKTPDAESGTEKTFAFEVYLADGTKEFATDIKTTRDTVGAALLDEGLIAGEESQYGLYVKTVHGVTADYDKDGTYWAFYIGNEYAMTGVDATPVTDGNTYSFRISK